MGFLTQKIKRKQVVAGDHIYTWRAAYTYSYHGIYIGRNKVVHFTPEQTMNPGKIPSLSSSKIFSSSSPMSSPCCDTTVTDCGFRQPESGVVLSCLDCFLGTGSLYRFEYKVSKPAYLTKLRGGTCTTAESDTCESVIHRAMWLLHNGFGKYNVFMNNCEDFAMYCKTGLSIKDKKGPGRGGQVVSVFGAPFSAIGSSSLFFSIPSPIATVIAAGIYCYSRYVADIGVRTDVEKVPVEDMGSVNGHKRKGMSILL